MAKVVKWVNMVMKVIGYMVAFKNEPNKRFNYRSGTILICKVNKKYRLLGGDHIQLILGMKVRTYRHVRKKERGE